MGSFDDYVNKCLENPEIRKEYEALEPEFELIRRILMAKDEELSDGFAAEEAGVAPLNSRAIANESFRVKYQDYVATVEYDPEAGYYVGTVKNTPSPVTFWSREREGFEAEFARSIRIWLDICKERGIMAEPVQR